MAPSQVISLMEMGGPTFAMSDHADHIHVGYTPDGSDSEAQPLSAMLKPEQWDKLLDRIGELDQPTVPTKPSKYSLPAKKRSQQRARRRVASVAPWHPSFPSHSSTWPAYSARATVATCCAPRTTPRPSPTCS